MEIMIAEQKETENTEREQEIVRASGVHNFVVTGFLPISSQTLPVYLRHASCVFIQSMSAAEDSETHPV